MKTLIQDEKTNQFYAVACEDNAKGYLSNAEDEGNPSTNDFPYWTDDAEEAFDFRYDSAANNEMSLNDLTEEGKRNPRIIHL